MFNNLLKIGYKFSLHKGFRKLYILVWKEQCSLLYNEYILAKTPEYFFSTSYEPPQQKMQKKYELRLSLTSTLPIHPENPEKQSKIYQEKLRKKSLSYIT